MYTLYFKERLIKESCSFDYNSLSLCIHSILNQSMTITNLNTRHGTITTYICGYVCPISTLNTTSISGNAFLKAWSYPIKSETFLNSTRPTNIALVYLKYPIYFIFNKARYTSHEFIEKYQRTK